jgi:hypothetical protein
LHRRLFEESRLPIVLVVVVVIVIENGRGIDYEDDDENEEAGECDLFTRALTLLPPVGIEYRWPGVRLSLGWPVALRPRLWLNRCHELRTK